MKLYKYFLIPLSLISLFSQSATAKWSVGEDSLLNIELIELDDTLLLFTKANFKIEELFEENTGGNIRMSSEPHMQIDSDELEIDLNSRNRTDVSIYTHDFEAELPAITSSISAVFDKVYHTDSCDYLSVHLNGTSIAMMIDDDYPTDGTEDIAFLAVSKDYDLDDFDPEISDHDDRSYSWTNTINGMELTVNFRIVRIQSEEDFEALTEVVNDTFQGSRVFDSVNASLADAYNPAPPTGEVYQSQWMYGGGFGAWVYSHPYESWAYPAHDTEGSIAYLFLYDSQEWVPNRK
ncbi:hypothetical protein [Rubellicoccus peritrichatus]|uniref:Uncharacterized protein n=1 Tax=Rubellicoccus peritrichatus TaxID=3080537 RepID=A0AAQ3LDC7_9BACT|nr:hypothetical protein [Puniceicoccus sp. CR14]WOO42369.1 hypothetical protein RZN69_04655 [Puniceicoccus sp. CR14]